MDPIFLIHHLILIPPQDMVSATVLNGLICLKIYFQLNLE